MDRIIVGNVSNRFLPFFNKHIGIFIRKMPSKAVTTVNRTGLRRDQKRSSPVFVQKSPRRREFRFTDGIFGKTVMLFGLALRWQNLTQQRI